MAKMMECPMTDHDIMEMNPMMMCPMLTEPMKMCPMLAEHMLCPMQLGMGVPELMLPGRSDMNPMMMGPINMAPMNMGPMNMAPMDMEPMNMGTANMGEMYKEEDEKDEKYFTDMYPDICTKLMPYVVETLDKAEQKDDKLYEGYPGGDMLRDMMGGAFKNIVADMPELADEDEEGGRQYGGRRFARDLVGVLLLNELLRRRRRRRYSGYYDYDYYPGYYNRTDPYEDYYY